MWFGNCCCHVQFWGIPRFPCAPNVGNVVRFREKAPAIGKMASHMQIERALEGKLIVLPSTNPERRDILAASRQRVQMVKARRRGKFVSLRSS